METIERDAPSLEVFSTETRVFSHDGRWLHPLFALEEYLKTADLDPGTLRLRDRIIGKAAAMLILRMGIRDIYGELMSDLAADFLVSAGASTGWGLRVPRIECQTEALFAESDDIEAAYRELRRRAGLA